MNHLVGATGTPWLARILARVIRRCSSALLSLGLLLSGAPALALDVHVMSSGNTTIDDAVVAALAARGYSASVGAQLCSWNGTNPDISAQDAVVLLNNYNWASCGSMPAAGEDALVAYVAGGGGLITGEWLIWNMDSPQKHKGLEPIIPADGGPFVSTASTTYQLVTADAVLNAGLPASFAFALANFSGTESILTPKAGATLFYTSTSTGAGKGGVIGWSYQAGRVISFSTFISTTELADSNYARLFGNAVAWAARQQPSLDHFLCYKTRLTRGSSCALGAPANAGSSCDAEEDCGGTSDATDFCAPNRFPADLQVSLQDAFEDKRFDVKKPAALCNPAGVDGGGIGDPQTHLGGYQIAPARGQAKTASRTLSIDNQFHPTGELVVTTMQPQRLLVPTAKSLSAPVEPPEDASTIDPFTCYAVKIPKGASPFPAGLEVTLVDQFDQEKRYDVKKPTRLCIPTDKDGEGIDRPDDQLMCYQVKAARGEPKHVKVLRINVNNVFGPDQLDTTAEEEVCVPSHTQAVPPA